MRTNAIAALVTLALAILTACRQDMHDQPKYIPLRPSSFFEDQRSARPLPEGTVARGQLRLDVEFYTGKIGAEFIDRFPFPVTRDVFDRGQQRFNIYCAPCHDRLGYGKGTIVRRGFRQPPSFHLKRALHRAGVRGMDMAPTTFSASSDLIEL